MKKILFVDDEPNILQGLRRMLRSMRHDFAMFFAEEGKKALEIMEEEDIDVVVSDMRMPGMDGAELLTEIRNRHPHTIRIMLTGQADEESTIRAIGIVHQFLSKPCDPDKLKKIIIQSGHLQEMFSNNQLKSIVSQIGTLPSLPKTYQELQKALQRTEPDIKEIGKIIEKDVAMCAKILQLVNSSFFGLYSNVTSPERAVTLLGFETIKTLVLGIGVFSQIKHTAKRFVEAELYDHSLKVAQWSKVIGSTFSEDSAFINDCFLSGMLHDIGKLIIATDLAQQYHEIIDRADQLKITVATSEEDILQADHGQIGAYLAGLWGFNANIVEALAFHNHPDRYPAEKKSPLMAVHLADVMYYDFFSEKILGAAPKLNLPETVSFEQSELDNLRNLCLQAEEKSSGSW